MPINSPRLESVGPPQWDAQDGEDRLVQQMFPVAAVQLLRVAGGDRVRPGAPTTAGSPTQRRRRTRRQRIEIDTA
jgi:hypothetical protein